MIDYVLRPLGHALAFPLVQFFLLILVAVLVGVWLKRRRLSRYLMVAAFGWLMLWSQSVPSQLLLHSLEYRFAMLSADDARWQKAKYISVLACGNYPDASLPMVSQWPRCSMQRLLHAAQMYRHSPRTIIVSGGMILESDRPFAEHAKALLIELGVQAKDILVVPEGETTHQEAAALKRIVGTEHVALVTSASHMQRAVNYFNNYQIDVIPVPVDHSGMPEINYQFTVPSSKNLQKAHKAFREYLGLIYQNFELG